MKPKLEVDPQGLAKLIEKKGKAWVLYELLQNSIDEEGVTEVTIHLEPMANRPVARIIVEDDSPEGFRNLSHAYTLFAESFSEGCGTWGRSSCWCSARRQRSPRPRALSYSTRTPAGRHAPSGTGARGSLG
jgi:hypothetical protein